MSTDLILGGIGGELASFKPEYQGMLANIEERLPAVLRDTSNFYKGHSQFMSAVLDATAITPLRSIYMALAEIEQTRAALQEAYINVRKKQVEIKRKTAQIGLTSDIFDQELLEIELIELQSQITTSQNYISGAIRKMNYFVNQHENLLQKIGKTEITEEDYEREEAKYHVMTAMKQALNAARSRGGTIDEGNAIYLFDLGINVADAQAEMFAYLQAEVDVMKQGQAPSHEMTLQWLEACANKWQSCPAQFAQRRGFSVLDKQSLNLLIPNTPNGDEA